MAATGSTRSAAKTGEEAARNAAEHMSACFMPSSPNHQFLALRICSPRVCAIFATGWNILELTLESRLPFAVAHPLNALIVGNDSNEHRSPVAARRLAVLMHGTMIMPEPIDKRRDVDPGRLAAHGM